MINTKINFENFLKDEFNLDFSNNKTVLDVDEIFKIEKNKKEIIEKIKKCNMLEHIIDKSFSKEKEKDIEDKIEEDWNIAFEKIRYELLNVENVLKIKNDKSVKQKNKKIKNFEKTKNLNSESLVYIWFGSFALVTTVFLLFFIFLDLIIPKYQENIALKEQVNNQVQIQRKATISKEARIEYIKNINHNDSSGKVAGVIEENKLIQDNNNFYQKLLNLFTNLF